MTLIEAAACIGVPQSTLTRWIQQGMVCPPGYVGRQRVEVDVTPKVLRELSVIAQLRRAGVSFQALRKVAKRLRAMKQNPFSSGRFVVLKGGELVKLCEAGEAVELIKHPGQIVVLLEEPKVED